MNYAISKLLLLAADCRIPTREVNSLGFVLQFLLQSVKGVAKEQDGVLAYAEFKQRIADIYESIPALQEVEDEEDEKSEETDSEEQRSQAAK
ncbi:MAG TPA: hypothetical protein VLW54_08805 [Candidatus Acidoferrales bacterium]|nr:hypothetical protein [Candidatus Acidoferrales bacterium]